MKLNAAVLLCASVGVVLAMPSGAGEAGRRLLSAADLDAFRLVADPTISPDGKWVACSVRTTDVAKDRRTSDIWMASWDGRTTVQLTHIPESEHAIDRLVWRISGRAVAAGRGGALVPGLGAGPQTPAVVTVRAYSC